MTIRRRMHITTEWFTKIKNLEKPLEGKKAGGSWGDLLPDQVITIYDDNEELTVLITKINYHKTLEEFLTKEGIQKCLPGVESFAKAKSIYTRFGIPKEDLDRMTPEEILIEEEKIETAINNTGGMQAIYLQIL